MTLFYFVPKVRLGLTIYLYETGNFHSQPVSGHAPSETNSDWPGCGDIVEHFRKCNIGDSTAIFPKTKPVL